MNRKRYAVVGTGQRGLGMFAKPIASELGQTAEVAALCDANPLRAAYAARSLGGAVPVFADFDEMLRRTGVDAVIIATPDASHADYVVRALRAGKRVFCEKPLCTTGGQCREILAAARRSGQQVWTTHNMRYRVACEAVWSILRSRRLGEVRFILFEETLDRCHGADYFRRWHRHKADSGGLQLHKASHHFDLLNWWADSRPQRVAAQGGLKFYGRNGPFHGPRCLGCQHAERCEFHVDMFAHEMMKEMYQDAESADGYLRDGCVFDPSIDIEDQFAVQIRYENGIEAAYTLLAYSPIETKRVVIEAAGGRLELHVHSTTGWAVGNNRVPGIEQIARQSLRLYIPGQGIEDVPLKSLEGSHGGADPQLRADFFARDWQSPPTPQMAGLDQAIQAVLIGAAVNKSLATGRPVNAQQLLRRD